MVQRNYTELPKQLYACNDLTGGALQPTILKAGNSWTKQRRSTVFGADFATSLLEHEEQMQEWNAAFDLLDALTRSGALPVEHASLHVLVLATHNFEKSVVETLIQDSVNPIDEVERSLLIMASVVHESPAKALLRAEEAIGMDEKHPVALL